MVFVAGLAVTVAPVVALRPVAGDQEKVAFGLFEMALSVIEPPEQIVAALGAMLTVGAPTVTVTSLVMVPQSVVVVTTWYVVVVVGATLTAADVARGEAWPFMVHTYVALVPL